MNYPDADPGRPEEVRCKGSYALGSACGNCTRCSREVHSLFDEGKISFPTHEAAKAWARSLGKAKPAGTWSHLDGPVFVFFTEERLADEDDHLRTTAKKTLVKIYLQTEFDVANLTAKGTPCATAEFKGQVDDEGKIFAQQFIEMVHNRCIQLSPKGQANSVQYGGNHYKGRSIEPWDYIHANQLGFFEGNAIKYLTRWKDKGGVEDLKKAHHYIQKLIEVTNANS